jgi:hypothetical protein
VNKTTPLDVALGRVPLIGRVGVPVAVAMGAGTRAMLVVACGDTPVSPAGTGVAAPVLVMNET